MGPCLVSIPNGSKPLCNFLVHLSSFLPGAGARLYFLERDLKLKHQNERDGGSADMIEYATFV